MAATFAVRASGRPAGHPVPDFAAAAQASALGHLVAVGHLVGRLVGRLDLERSFIASLKLVLTEKELPFDRGVPLNTPHIF
jgi:hypothetical protein